MADRRQVRPNRMQNARIGGEILPIHIPRRDHEERYLHFSNEHSMYQSVVGLEKTIEFFGYAPKVIQTDKGSEFTDRGGDCDILAVCPFLNIKIV